MSFPAPWLHTPELVLLILLLAGHATADFLLQTRAMVERKAERPVLFRHAALVVLSPSPETDVQRMGRTIGILERMLALTLVVMGQWEGIGWLFAGKTVARFRELDNRAFSEYYLIGTLASLLFAAATGLAVRLALRGSL